MLWVWVHGVAGSVLQAKLQALHFLYEIWSSCLRTTHTAVYLQPTDPALAVSYDSCHKQKVSYSPLAAMLSQMILTTG